MSSTEGRSPADRHSAGDGSTLTRPHGADEHRRALLARLPSRLAHMLTEPLGPLGLAGATVGATEHRSRDELTALLLRDFAARSGDPLPEWDFGDGA